MGITTAAPIHRRRTRPRPELVSVTDAGVGAAIRDLRQRRGLHQDELAKATGIDASVLSRIERGERACRVAELSAIAAGLHTRASMLLRRAHRRR